MKEKLDMLRKRRFLELSSWAGLSDMPGTSGLIITDDKMIYRYHNYYFVPEHLKDKIEKEYISDGELLSEDAYLKLVKYINKKIKGKKFKDYMIFDAGCNIYGKDFHIENYFDIYNDLNNIIGG